MICAIHGRELSLRLLAGRWELAAADSIRNDIHYQIGSSSVLIHLW